MSDYMSVSIIQFFFSGTICHSRKSGSPVPSGEGNEEMCVEETDSKESKEEGLSDLGQLVCHTDSVFAAVVMSVFNALTWNDSVTCNRCTTHCWLLIKQLVVDSK